jgi:RNA polymerase sigma factor (sigma-70 family)
MIKQQRRITKQYFAFACSQYAPLINKLAFRIASNRLQAEEFRAKANDELLKCMICYCQGGSFLTFVYGRIHGLFMHMLDAEKRAKRIQIVSIDSAFDIASPVVDVNMRIMVEELISFLSDNERAIIYGLFFGDKTIREVSLEQNIVPSTVCRIRERAIGKMRRVCVVR